MHPFVSALLESSVHLGKRAQFFDRSFFFKFFGVVGGHAVSMRVGWKASRLGEKLTVACVSPQKSRDKNVLERATRNTFFPGHEGTKSLFF